MSLKLSKYRMCFSILILLLSRSRAQDYGEEENKCDIVVFMYRHYDRQILFGGYGRAFNLFMHELSGDLFFSHASRHENLNNRQIMTCNSRKNYCTYVRGITNGLTIAFDRNTDELFFGGTDGIYKYNFFVQKANRIAAAGVQIWDIFHYGFLFYYVVHPTQRLYVVRDRKFDDLELVIYTEVDHFHIIRMGDKDWIYITNKTGIYKMMKNPDKQKVLSNDTNIQVRQISRDGRGYVYFAANDGIYRHSKRLKRMMRVPIGTQVYGMTIINVQVPENSMIILYSDDKNIYRILPSKNVDCINEYIEKRKKHHEKKNATNNTLRFSLKLF